MASNPTPSRLEELIAAMEDLADGVHQHAAGLGIVQNTEAKIRNELQVLTNAVSAAGSAHAQTAIVYAVLLRPADSNAKGFLAKAIKVLSIAYGNDWSAAWEATGLPDQTVGVPGTQDGRRAEAYGSILR